MTSCHLCGIGLLFVILASLIDQNRSFTEIKEKVIIKVAYFNPKNKKQLL